MKIAILSDTRLPTAARYPGHGLGKVMLALAEGLQARGHEVGLFAGKGSEFDGPLAIGEDERQFVAAIGDAWDAILDGGHFHTLSQQRPELPVINMSHDREAKPGPNAVFVSKAHKAWHKQPGRVIYNGVDVERFPFGETGGDYLLYVSTFYAPKGPVAAWNVARLAGMPLVMCGPTPPAPPPGVRYVGPVSGEHKWALMAGAKALVFPGAIEAGPVTPLEAQACGCPVLVMDYGAAPENMADGLTGFVARDTLEMAERVGQVDTLDRATVRQWIADNRSFQAQIEGIEQALTDVASGLRW